MLSLTIHVSSSTDLTIELATVATIIFGCTQNSHRSEWREQRMRGHLSVPSGRSSSRMGCQRRDGNTPFKASLSCCKEMVGGKKLSSTVTFFQEIYKINWNKITWLALASWVWIQTRGKRLHGVCMFSLCLHGFSHSKNDWWVIGLF